MIRREKIIRISPLPVVISRSSNIGPGERRSSSSRDFYSPGFFRGEHLAAVLPIISSRDIPQKRSPAPFTSTYRRSSARLTKIADGTLLMIRSRKARLRSRSCSAWRCSVISSKVATQPAGLDRVAHDAENPVVCSRHLHRRNLAGPHLRQD